jgi:hypothetical protein
MLPCEYMLAVVLLTGPPSVADPDHLQATIAALRQPLQSIAVQWEILDPREIRYILASPGDFVSDLGLLRRRHRDLAHAPVLRDCQRFPDRSTINGLLALNRAYRRELDRRQIHDPHEAQEIELAICDADLLYQAWDCLRDARSDFYYVTVRRQAFKRFKELIGEGAYYKGTLPPCVPLWRFRASDWARYWHVSL